MVRRALRSTARPILRIARRIRRRADEVTVRSAVAGIPDLRDARIEAVRTARNRTHLVTVRVDGDDLQLVKLSDRPAGHDRLAHERDALLLLGERLQDPELRAAVPRVLQHGTHGTWAYLAQSQLPGLPATTLLTSDADSAWVMEAAADLGERLHAATRRRTTVGDAELTAWVDRPLAIVAELLGHRSAIDALGRRLRDALRGADVELGCVHGDYWSENVLVDRAERRVTGVVDWDSADLGGLALHDQLHLALYARKSVRGGDIGTHICAALDESVDDRARGGVSDPHVRLALYWLRLVEMNVRRQPVQSNQRAWIRNNVAAVLACL